MNKILTLAFVAGVGLAGMSYAQAMSPAPLNGSGNEMIVRVAGGCGAGFHRGPHGGCIRNWANPVAHPCARGWHMGPGGHCRRNW